MKEIVIYFNPFNNHLLGLIKNYVYFKEIIYNEGEDNKNEYCVLKIKKPLFQKMINNYLEEKEDFCRRYNHFCGCGDIGIDDFETNGKMNILVGFDDDNEVPIYKDVPVYLVSSYSIDMEHG